MELSENQKLVQKLKQILGNCPGIEYDEHTSAGLDDGLIVKVSLDVRCDIDNAANIARKLNESMKCHHLFRRKISKVKTRFFLKFDRCQIP